MPTDDIKALVEEAGSVLDARAGLAGFDHTESKGRIPVEPSLLHRLATALSTEHEARVRAEGAWCEIADYLEPHWRGAGAEPFGPWALREVAHRGRRWCEEEERADALTARIAELEASLAKAEGERDEARTALRMESAALERADRRQDRLEEALGAATARIAELEEGLRPFAKMAEVREGFSEPDDANFCTTVIDGRTGTIDAELTVGDLRRARALLKQGEG